MTRSNLKSAFPHARFLSTLLIALIVLLTAHISRAQLPDAPTPAHDDAQQDTDKPPKRLDWFIRPSERPHLPGATPISPLTFREQTHFYMQQTFGPASFLLCTYPPAVTMAFPPNKYPKDWKDGSGAYARNYGDVFAVHFAAQTTKYLTAALVHEDPRYFAAESTNPVARTVHAIGFTLFDRSRNGSSMLAVSNIAGAFAGGFVGRAYLPHGYNDNTHALQRSLGLIDGEYSVPILGTTTHNLIQEFTPELVSLGRKLHLVRKPQIDESQR